jgi:ATP-dependent RNA circularization protein (DNA/RNA ligase family)
MVEYNKIETLWERDMDGSKKLMEGKFRNPTVEYLKDNTWVFTEKVDGTNIRVYWDGHKVTFGGRTEDAQIPSHLLNKLIEMFKTDEAEQIFEQKFGEMPVMLFGEGYGPKIQKGGSYRSDVSFILFDVLIGGNYQPRSSVEDIAKAFGIDIVPIIMEGTIEEAVAYVKTEPKSTIGTAPMEGLVGRPKVEMRDRCGKRVIVKIKVKDITSV